MSSPTVHHLAIAVAALTIVTAAAGAAAPGPTPKGKPPPKSKTLAIMVILDVSGSMNVLVDGETRMWHADSATIGALGTLGPKDYIGVLAVDTKPYLVVPLQPPHPALEPMIRRITAGGGGIFIYRALERARVELEKIETSRKHVILFSDAADAEEMCEGFAFPPEDGCPAGRATAHDSAKALAARGITLTVVALGHPSDSDVDELEGLAASTRSRFLITADARELEPLFVEDAKLARKGPAKKSPAKDTAPPSPR